MNYNSSCVKDPQLEHTFLNFFVEYIWVIIKKMEQSRKAKRKKIFVHFFFFFNEIVLLAGAYRI